MLASFLYLVLRRLLSLVATNHRSDDAAQIEILVLRHQLGVLRRQVKRPVYRRRDRALLAAASRILPKEHWGAFPVRPETLLRWHRSLVARKWTRPYRRLGRLGVHVVRAPVRDARWGRELARSPDAVGRAPPTRRAFGTILPSSRAGSRCHDRVPARSRGGRRVRGAYQLELSGRDGITRELLGLRAGSLHGVRLASARPTRRRAASA
jgi:hypothetical protein